MPDSTVLLDREVIVESLGSKDPALIAEFYQLFISHADQVAASLEAARRSHDLVSLRAHAHQLKSSAESVGAMALAASLKKLELAALARDSEASAQCASLVSEQLQASCDLIRAVLSQTGKVGRSVRK